MKKKLIFCLAALMAVQSFGQVNGQKTAKTGNDILKEMDDDFFSSDEDFNSFIINNEKEFSNFLDSINDDYAKFLEKEWKSAPFGGVIKREKDKEIKPIIKKDKEGEQKKDLVIKGQIIPIEKGRKPQPKPVVPILENKLDTTYNTFTFYGTPLKVRWGNASKLKFAEMTNKEIAKAFRALSSVENKNLLHDCLNIRKEYELCDWAYYKMLEAMAEAACGKGTNEAIFLHGYVYGQSGYTMRFAIDPKTKRLYLLCRIIGGAYEYPYYTPDGQVFYLFEKEGRMALDYCPKDFKGEQEMSLEINKIPKLTKSLSAEKVIYASAHPVRISSQSNKNLINFFNGYPTSYKDNNFMTRWAYYANTPPSDEIKKYIYPVLKEKIQGLPPVAAVNLILDWVRPLSGIDTRPRPKDGQVGFPYGYDNEIWGYDRAFFADETLYYSASDCEDHAILFSRIIRDLLHLDVVLVYYPSHLATAVYLGNDVKGDAIMVDDRRFMVCDPTLYRGKVGVTMPQFEDTDPKDIKVILLDN